jgi:segregation and condensation protein B
MELSEFEPVIEALLFTSGDPVPLNRIAEVIEIDKKTARLVMKNLILNYNASVRGIMIREINEAYQLCTKAEYFQYICKLFEPRQKQALS